MKIGFTCGTFDLLHAGHILMLNEAKSVCDKLIVGIQTDPTVDRPSKNKPIQTIIERTIQVKGCRFVDDIIVYQTEQDLEDILINHKIDIRIIGVDHKDTWTTGKEVCKKKNIEIYYNKRNHRWSTTELRKRIQEQKI